MQPAIFNSAFDKSYVMHDRSDHGLVHNSHSYLKNIWFLIMQPEEVFHQCLATV